VWAGGLIHYFEKEDMQFSDKMVLQRLRITTRKNYLYIKLQSKFYSIFLIICCWAMGWTIGVLGFDSQWGLGIFLFTTMSRTALGSTQPPIQWVPWALPLGVSGQGMKLTTQLHLVPRSSMHTAIPPLHQYVFMAWCLVKHKENFTFTFFTFY
jgi:hypothetical protein